MRATLPPLYFCQLLDDHVHRIDCNHMLPDGPRQMGRCTWGFGDTPESAEADARTYRAAHPNAPPSDAGGVE